MALTTTSEYKTYAGVSGSTNDARYATLISAAEAYIKRYTGRSFESATFTHTFDGSGGESLQLREWPVTSITSVTQIYDDGTTQVLDASTYRFDGTTNNGILYRVFTGRGRFGAYNAAQFGRWEPGPFQRFGNGYVWDMGYQNYRVVYVAGYTTIPDELKLLVWKIVDVWFAGAGQDASLQSESIGSYSYTRAKEPFPPEIQLMLDGWKVGQA